MATFNFGSVYIRSNCLFVFAMSQNYLPVNSLGYKLGLFNGSCSCFTPSNTLALVDKRDANMKWFVYARRRYVTMVDMGHGLATLNSQ